MIKTLFQCFGVLGVVCLFGCSEKVNSGGLDASVKQGSDGAGDQRIQELVTDSVSYVYELSLIRGHLWVAERLSMTGYLDHAAMHAKHPEDEIYSDLVEVFEAKGLPGFASELSTFSNSVVSGNKKAIEQDYLTLVDAIKGSQGSLELTVGELLELVNRLISQAAREYAVGIIDGQVNNVHEYQDARGFIEIAMDLTQNHAQKVGLSENQLVVIGLLRDRLEDLLEMWPALVPVDEVPFEASRLFGAAADVEILSLSL